VLQCRSPVKYWEMITDNLLTAFLELEAAIRERKQTETAPLIIPFSV